MKRRIRLTEHDVYMLVAESVRLAMASGGGLLYEGRGGYHMLNEGRLRAIVSRVIDGMKRYIEMHNEGMLKMFARENGLSVEDIESMDEQELNGRIQEWMSHMGRDLFSRY